MSETIERLSPNIAPHTAAPMQRGIDMPVFSLMLIAIGARVTIVPTEVPIDVEIKQPTTNTPTMAIFPGIIERPKLTAESAPPAAFTDAENAPASINTRHIIIMFSSPAPFAMLLSFCSNESFSPFGFCKNATTRAITNPTMAGRESPKRPPLELSITPIAIKRRRNTNIGISAKGLPFFIIIHFTS